MFQYFPDGASMQPALQGLQVEMLPAPPLEQAKVGARWLVWWVELWLGGGRDGVWASIGGGFQLLPARPPARLPA
jgi:hypothetical protein